MDLLIISAAEFEVTPTLEVLRDLGINFTYMSCGIGCLNAARSTLTLAEKAKNKDVLFIGTCGTFADFHNLELIVPKTIKWLPTCERFELSWSIENISPDFTLNKILPWAKILNDKTVICSPNISKSNKLPYNLSITDCVENLELYSIVSDIQLAARSFTPILAVTNHVGPDGRLEWRDNFVNASITTAKFIKNNLKG